MDTKRFITGTVVGGLVLWGVGYLIFQVLFANFYAANAGTATGVMRDSPILWAVIVGNLFEGALLTLVLGWAAATSIGAGIRVGAIVGLLVWAGVDFIFYGISNLNNLTLTIVDPLLELVHFGVAGAVVAAVTGKRASAPAA